MWASSVEDRQFDACSQKWRMCSAALGVSCGESAMFVCADRAVGSHCVRAASVRAVVHSRGAGGDGGMRFCRGKKF